MGGQSVAAARLHVATTYLTGTLTGALHDLVLGKSGGRMAAVGQLVALTAGAAAAAALLANARWATPALPIVLLTVAVGARLMTARSSNRGADRSP
jgi:hypothetical protein